MVNELYRRNFSFHISLISVEDKRFFFFQTCLIRFTDFFFFNSVLIRSFVAKIILAVCELRQQLVFLQSFFLKN